MKAILTSSLGGQIKVDGKRIPTLRKKLEAMPDSPQYIQTHIGVGYRMMKIE